MVIVIHSASEFVIAPGRGADFWLATTVDGLSRVAVPLFVMLSGRLILPRRIDDWAAFYKRAFRRLVLPTAIWTIFYVGLRYVEYFEPGHFQKGPPSLVEPILGILAGAPFFHLWFMYMLVGLYLFAPMLERAWRSLSDAEALTTTSIAFLLAMGAEAKNSVTGENIWWGLSFVSFLGYFLAGGFIERIKRPMPARWLIAGYAGASALTVVLMGLAIQHGLPGYPFGYLSVTTVAASLFLGTFLFTRQAAPRRWIRSISDHSYTIYLAHAAVLDIIWYPLNRSGLSHAIVLIPLRFGIVFSTSLMIAMLLKQIASVGDAQGRSSPLGAAAPST